MILVDSNIPMYLIGRPHPHQSDVRRLLERSVAEKTPLVTDVEVFQEILHRYTSINRRDAIQPAFDALLDLAEEIYAVEAADVERAKTLVLSNDRISARDPIHVAIMQRIGIKRIMSFDSGFDQISGVTRIYE